MPPSWKPNNESNEKQSSFSKQSADLCPCSTDHLNSQDVEWALAEPFFGLRAEENEENYKWEKDKHQWRVYETVVGKSFNIHRETRIFAGKGLALKRP